MADRGVGRSAPAAAAGAGCSDESEPFVSWASTQRRRAALDGAWRVEVAERFVHGVRVRSVTSWHNVQQQHASSRRVRPQRGVSAGSDARPAAGEHPQRQTARQRRSALRSAAHHKRVRLRALRSHLLAVRFLVRLLRLSKAARALRAQGGGVRFRGPGEKAAFEAALADIDAELSLSERQAPEGKKEVVGVGIYTQPRVSAL